MLGTADASWIVDPFPLPKFACWGKGGGLDGPSACSCNASAWEAEVGGFLGLAGQ